MNRVKSFDNENNILYLIATPIGNLQEFTPRALNILKECDVVAAEDTRNTKLLLSHFDIHKNLISLREHNEIVASQNVIKLIKEGKKVVYVSDAGYPCISDPGNILVKIALGNGIKVSTISGSSAFINALVASGLDANHFYFHGFLSPKTGECEKELEELKFKSETLIFYESPHRINDTLKSLLKVLGNRNAVIARELTKINEEYIRGSLEELVLIDDTSLKGEMVVIVEGNKTQDISDESIKEYVGCLMRNGMSEKSAIETTAELLKTNKNRVKKLIINK